MNKKAIKEFLKLTKKKILLFIIIAIISYNVPSGYEYLIDIKSELKENLLENKIQIEKEENFSKEFIPPQPCNCSTCSIINAHGFPVPFSGQKFCGTINAPKYFSFSILFLDMLFWYVLSCLIISIYTKRKSKTKA